MSDPITVTVTSLAPDTVKVNGASSQSVQILNGGAVNVAVGSVAASSPAIVSGTLAINSVTTLAAGSQAYVKNDLGTAYAAKLDIGIPAGPATSVTVAKTTTLAAGSNATVTGVTEGGSLALSFGIPAGAAGTNGTTPTITATATTLAAGSSATVTATPSDGGSKVALAFGIPRGADGSGGGGASLSDATPSTLGTASAGTSTTASRSDHVHATPVISYANLTNVPSTFAPSTHTHTASQITDLSASVATSVAGRTGDVEIAVDDVAGLFALVAGASSDVDGGDYVGALITPSITITSQPASYAASLAIGSSWTQTGYGNSYWRAVAYNGSRWVIVGNQYNSPSGYYTSTSTDAVNWTTRGNQNSPRVAAYNLATDGTAFMTVGTSSVSGGMYATSTDGLTWTSGSMPTSSLGLCYGNSRYMAVGSSSTFSTNGGTSWSTPVTLPATCNAVAYGSSGFVALPSASSSSAYLSADGASWSTVTLPSSTVWASIASSGSAYVAIRSGSSSTAAYSANGTTWSSANLPASRSWRGASYVAGKFWVFAANAAAYSTDGQTWSSATLPVSSNWVGAAGGASSVLAVSFGTASHVYSVASSAATFTIGAVSTATLSYQWQLSTDAGSTFSAVSGATGATLSLSGLTTADSGKKYRCIISATGTSSVTSDAATLTVT